MRRNVGYVLGMRKSGLSVQVMKAFSNCYYGRKEGVHGNLEEILSLDDIDMVQFGLL